MSGSSIEAARGRFTGCHMAAILVAGFGVVIAVNVTMARLAISTFGGVVVENSYVASQHFNRWLDEASAERKLGWTAEAARRADGRLTLRLGNVPGSAKVSGEARHPLGTAEDIPLAFAAAADGSLVSRQIVPAGRWTLRLAVEAGGRIWRTEQALQ